MSLSTRPSPRHRRHVDRAERTGRTRALTASALASFSLVAVVAGAAVTAAPAEATSRNLVVNPGFEHGYRGWKVTGDHPVGLGLTAWARSGLRAARLSAARNGTVVLNDRVNTVRSTVEGATYTATAFVRASKPGMTIQLRQREAGRTGVVGRGRTAVRMPDTRWHRISTTYVAAASGDSIDLNVLVFGMKRTQYFQVDDVTLRKSSGKGKGRATPSPTDPSTSSTPTPTTTSPAPTPTPTTTSPAPTPTPTTTSPTPTPTPTTTSPTPTPTPTTTTPTPTPTPTTTTPTATPTPTAAFDRKGIPTGHAVLFGSAIGGNTAPDSRESQVGGHLGLHRTYWNGSNVSSAVSMAKSDLANHRVPWLSFKLPYSWSAMASGTGDAWARDLATRLGALNGPVWVAFHHEPEGDGPIADWVAMQRHLSPIMRTQPNIAFTIITTGWDTFFANNPAYTLDALLPDPSIVDVVGIDAYNEYGVTKNGKTSWTMTELKTYYAKVGPWAAAHHVHWAIAETGYTDLAAAKDVNWITRAYDDMGTYGGIGLSYFDSALNPIGDSTWSLDPPAKLNAFAAVLARSPRW